MTPNLDNLIGIFQKMNANGFDTNCSLKWAFYFVDTDKEKLQNLFSELKDKDYVLEDIYLVEGNDKEWTLKASKIDILTPEKLHKRNIAFNELADYCEVELYDGWDVERLAL